MATSRRRTSKKSVGQNLNELERRVKAVERRPSPSYIQNSLIDSSAVAVGSITLDNLDPSLRAIILGSLSNNATTGSSFGETGVVVADNTSEVTFTSNRTASRTTVFYQTTEPDTDGRIDGDLWYDTDNDFKPYRWGFQTVSITQVVVSGSGSARSAVYTTSASHTITTDEILRVEGVTGSGGIDLLNGDWDITAQTSNTITVSIGSGTGITNGTYTGLSATGTSNLGEWFEAPFGDAALTSLTVGKLLTGTLNVATVATVGDPLAAGGTGTGGSIVISGGTGFTGIKLFKPDGTNTVFLDALTGDASFTGTITGSVFRTSANVGNGSTAGVLINSSGANFYNNSSATAVTSISASTGVLTATGANITGTLTATTGAIGGFNIGETTLYAPLSNPTILLDSGNSQIRLGLAGTGTANVIYAKADTGIWAGHHTFASASFSVSVGGVLTARSGTVGGWTLGTTSLSSNSDGVALNAPTTVSYSTTATGTSGTNTITLASATNFAIGQEISGTGIPENTYITNLVGTTATLDQNLTANLSATTVTVFDIAFYAGSGATRYLRPFRVDYAGNLRAANASITGTVNATAGNIGSSSTTGWAINNDWLRSRTASFSVSQAVISGTTPEQTGVLTTTATHSFIIGNAVFISGLTGNAAVLNGTRVITAVSSATFTVAAPAGSTNGTYSGQSGTAATKSVTLDGTNSRIYIASGIGSYSSADTAFYADAAGNFSISNKLIFDPGNTNRDGFATLTVIGRIRGAIDNVAIVPPDQNSVSVTSSTITGTGPFTVVLTASGHTFLTGDTVIVTGLTGGAANANGAWRITAKTSTTFTYVVDSGVTAGGPTAQTASARVRELTLGLHTALNGSPAGLGIRLDEYNYWFVNNQFRVGTAGSYVSWNGSVLEVTGTVNASAGNFTGFVTAGTTATMRFGGSVQTGKNGLFIDANNYWYDNDEFSLGSGTAGVTWNPSTTTLTVTGTVNATAGNFKDKLTIGIAPTTASFGDNLNKSVYGPRELGIKLDPYNYWALIANPLSVAASGLSPVFYIGSADTNKPDYLEYDIQGDLTVSGTVLAVQGSDIGGWSVGNGLLYAGSGATFTAMSNETGSIPESGTLQMANIIVDDEFYFYFDPDLPEDLGEYSTIYITIPYSSDTTLGGLYENALTKYEGSTISFNSTLPTSPSLTYLQGSSFSVVKVLPGGYKLGTESPDKRVDEDFTTYPQATHFTLVVYGEDASPLPLVIGNTTNFTSGGLAHSSSTFTKTPNGRPTTSSTSGTSFVYDTVTYTTTTTHNYVEGEFVTVTGFTGTYAAVFNKTSAAITSVTTNTFTVANPYKDVRLATTANIASLSGAATVDGVAAVTGNRILVKNQTTASQNGIYVANTSGAWTRATDFDQATTGEVETGATIRVSAGSTLANTTWVLTTTGTITVGTTSLTFTQPASPQSSSGTGTITNLNIINISNGNTLPRPRPGMSISGTNIPAGPPTTKISLVETGNVIVHLDTPTTGSPGTTANSLTLGNVGDVSANTTALIAYDTYVSSDLGYFLWAGSEDPTTSPFSIKADGVINASSGTVGGWTLSSNAISQTLTDTNKSFLVELRAPTSITSSIDYLKGLAYNNIANDYYGLINISMRYDSLSSTLTPFINIVNKGIVDNAFSDEDGNLSTQNIYIYGRTPNSSLYSPVLRNLPSMTFDGPDGAIAGMLGAYNNKVFGIESVSGDSYINMNDLTLNTRGVIISSSGGTSNLNSAIISASGHAGVVSLGAYSGVLICSIDLDASTRKIDSSGNLIRSLMAVRAYYDESGAATGTALTAGTYVSVRFNTENFNSFFTQGQFNTSASGGVRWYEVPYAGYYRVSGAAYFTGGGTAGRREVRVQLVDNGTTPTAATDGVDYCHLVIPAGGVTAHSVVFSDVVYADESSDKIVVWARSVTDAGVELTEGTSRTFITIEYIGSNQ